MPTSESIERQIEILEKQLKLQPEKCIGGKWNPRHFALKGKIKNLQRDKIKQRQYEFLAR